MFLSIFVSVESTLPGTPHRDLVHNNQGFQLGQPQECATKILSMHLQSNQRPLTIATQPSKAATAPSPNQTFGNLHIWLCFYSLLTRINWSGKIQDKKSCNAHLRKQVRSFAAALSRWTHPYSRWNLNEHATVITDSVSKCVGEVC